MKIILPFKIKEKMRLYVESIDKEISGFGKVTFEDEDCIIQDIKIFKQEVTSGSSDLEGENIAQFITEMTQKNKSLKNWTLWWHSHNDMNVFWSETDTSTMEQNPLDAQHMLSIVTNNKGEYKARLDIYEPTHVFIDNIEISVELPQDNSLKNNIEKEVKKLVTQPKPKTIYKKPKYKPQPPVIVGGYWNSKKNEWIEEEEYEYEFNKQNLTIIQIKEEAKKMAKEFSIEELAQTLADAEEDQDVPYDSYRILEEAFEIKIEQEELKELKKDNKSNNKKNASK